MRNERVQVLVQNAIFVALYIVVTNIFGAISFNAYQFRISMAMIAISYFNKSFAVGTIMAVALSNLFSPLGIIDVIIGGSINVVAQVFNKYIKNKYIVAAIHSITIALFVGFELDLIYKLSIKGTFMPLFISNAVILIGATAGLYFLQHNKPNTFKKLTLQKTNK